MIKQLSINKAIGVYFDLNQLFFDLNQRFFFGTISAQIKWGAKKKPLKAKRSIRLGSYHPQKKVIIIHPCLDQAIVPKICIERILFHEMAHQHLPSIKSPCGKTLSHYPKFNEFEKNYPYLKEADLWLKTHLPRLLAY
jgi:predicted metal-dependent hydrolase